MKRKKQKVPEAAKKDVLGLKDTLSLYSELADLQKEILKSSEAHTIFKKRLWDIEIHINLLTRLLTTLCIEKFGMRALTLKRLVRRIEKEVSRDSQIMELESLYSLSNPTQKKTSVSPQKGKGDPWEQIS